MTLSMTDSLAVSSLAKHLYDFLPASGNNVTSFPISTQQAGIPEAWPTFKVSKLPGITHMLTWTLESRRDRFTELILSIVKQSITWRKGKETPLSRHEVEELNRLLLPVRFKIPELCDEDFLKALAQSSAPVPSAILPTDLRVSEATYQELIRNLLELAGLQPRPRGYAFEKFLVDLFLAFDLAPRGAFRLVGEQIDGSFVLHYETFLVEAKWRNDRTGADDLRSFSMKVADKATWSRGLFLSNSGFTEDGLEALGRGSPIILMDGLDLYELLNRRLSLVDVLAAKTRRAAETGRPYVPVREMF
jgi:restriction endonuclease Mrr